MDAVVYWRGALGLFWAFMFFTLLSLIIGLTYLGASTFYPYAVLLSAVLVVFLTAFLLFDKRIKAGFYMCVVLSVLFLLNQATVLYFLFFQPTTIFPPDVLGKLVVDEAIFFPLVVAVLLLLWALFLVIATVKSRPVFEKEAKLEQIGWLVRLKAERPRVAPEVLKAKKDALRRLATQSDEEQAKKKKLF